MSRVLVLFKPDCYARGLVGECLARFERRGFRVAGIKALRPILAQIETHYAEHQAHRVYPQLLKMMGDQPLVAAVLVHPDLEAAAVARAVLGPFTDPAPGTIRGDYATARIENVVHVSDSATAAEREIKLWFFPAELIA